MKSNKSQSVLYDTTLVGQIYSGLPKSLARGPAVLGPRWKVLILGQPVMVWHLVVHHLPHVGLVNFLPALFALIKMLPLVVRVSVCLVSNKIAIMTIQEMRDPGLRKQRISLTRAWLALFPVAP